MINNCSQYKAALMWQTQLNTIVTAGDTSLFDPALIVMGVGWAQNELTKITATINAFLTATP